MARPESRAAAIACAHAAAPLKPRNLRATSWATVLAMITTRSSDRDQQSSERSRLLMNSGTRHCRRRPGIAEHVEVCASSDSLRGPAERVRAQTTAARSAALLPRGEFAAAVQQPFHGVRRLVVLADMRCAAATEVEHENAELSFPLAWTRRRGCVLSR